MLNCDGPSGVCRAYLHFGGWGGGGYYLSSLESAAMRRSGISPPPPPTHPSPPPPVCFQLPLRNPSDLKPQSQLNEFVEYLENCVNKSKKKKKKTAPHTLSALSNTFRNYGNKSCEIRRTESGCWLEGGGAENKRKTKLEMARPDVKSSKCKTPQKLLFFPPNETRRPSSLVPPTPPLPRQLNECRPDRCCMSDIAVSRPPLAETHGQTDKRTDELRVCSAAPASVSDGLLDLIPIGSSGFVLFSFVKIVGGSVSDESEVM